MAEESWFRPSTNRNSTQKRWTSMTVVKKWTKWHRTPTQIKLFSKARATTAEVTAETHFTPVECLWTSHQALVSQIRIFINNNKIHHYKTAHRGNHSRIFHHSSKDSPNHLKTRSKCRLSSPTIPSHSRWSSRLKCHTRIFKWMRRTVQKCSISKACFTRP